MHPGAPVAFSAQLVSGGLRAVLRRADRARGGNTSNSSVDKKKGSSHGQNQALTVLFMPYAIDCGLGAASCRR